MTELETGGGDRFFFDAFKDLASDLIVLSSETELVTLPDLKFTAQEYIARVIGNNCYVTSSDKFAQSLGRFIRLSQAAEDYHAATVKVMRSILGLDSEHEPRHVKESVTQDELQDELNRTFLEAALNDLTNQRFYPSGKTFYEQLVSVARQIDHESGLIAKTLQDPGHFNQVGYNLVPYMGDHLDDKLLSRDKLRLRLRDKKVPSGIRDIAETLVGLYPLLNNRGIREQILDDKDLSYTICASFAPEVLQSEEYRKASIAVVKSSVPAKLKFITSMMYISSDNLFRVADLLTNMKPEGYDGRRKH